MGRPFAQDRQFTPFGEFVIALAESKDIKVLTLQKIVGRTRLYEALREAPRKRRTPKLSHAELSEIAELLNANEQETHKLVLLGLLQHAPPELASCVIRAITHTVAQAKRLGVRPPKLDFTGDVLKLPDVLP